MAYNWSYGHFVTFLPILANIWLLWQRPLDPCSQKYLWIGSLWKPSVTSNHILIICSRNAFIAVSVQKLVVIVMPVCPLCTKVSQMNSLIAETISQNQTLHWLCCIQLKLCPFLWDFAHFGNNWWDLDGSGCERHSRAFLETAFITETTVVGNTTSNGLQTDKT